MSITFESRAAITPSPIAKRLFNLMAHKKTNLALSADVTSAKELLSLADQLGPEICVLKTHIDIINDFSPSLTTELKMLAKKHDFLLFEDRKFADIGNTVMHQFQGGIYRIADWADIINAHTLPGPGIIKGLQQGAHHSCGLLLLAEMSSKDNLFTKDYVAATLEMANAFPDFVIGFITQHALSDNLRFIHFTPGVKLDGGRDALGQQYVTPEQAIIEHKTDVVIVGRGIIQAKNPLAQTNIYRERCFKAYLDRSKGF